MIRSNSRCGKPHKNHAFISLADGEQDQSQKRRRKSKKEKRKNQKLKLTVSHAFLTLILHLTCLPCHLPKIVSLKGQNHRT